MQTPTMNAAILLAYAYVPDGEVAGLLRGILNTADNSLDFLHECAFKLQTLHYLAYISHGRQRMITRTGQIAANQVRAALIQQHGQLADTALIWRLTAGCITELADWVAINKKNEWEQIERTATAVLMEK